MSHLMQDDAIADYMDKREDAVTIFMIEREIHAIKARLSRKVAQPATRYHVDVSVQVVAGA